MINGIPLCFYPFRKMILDDDNNFLDSFLLKFHDRKFISYNSPEVALDFLQNSYIPKLKKNDLVMSELSIPDTSTRHPIQINIDQFKKFSSCNNFDDINVLLIDHHMPKMLGIEFLREIQHLPIKKILITGENDYKIAVDAFNDGLLDAYLKKNDPDFNQKILQLIADLEWQYFNELCQVVVAVTNFNFLRNINVVKIFKQFIAENHISQFYMINMQGDFIVQDAFNKKIYFLLREKAQLNELAKVAEEDGATVQTIEYIKSGKMIPYFDDKDYWSVPASEWKKFLYPAKEIIFEKKFFYTVIKKEDF